MMNKSKFNGMKSKDQPDSNLWLCNPDKFMAEAE